MASSGGVTTYYSGYGAYPEELKTILKNKGMPLDELPKLQVKVDPVFLVDGMEQVTSQMKEAPFSSLKRLEDDWGRPWIVVWIQGSKDKTQQAVVGIFQKYAQNSAVKPKKDFPLSEWDYRSSEGRSLAEIYADAGNTYALLKENPIVWLIKLLNREDSEAQLCEGSIELTSPQLEEDSKEPPSAPPLKTSSAESTDKQEASSELLPPTTEQLDLTPRLEST
jgi:hypothetical protein